MHVCDCVYACVSVCASLSVCVSECMWEVKIANHFSFRHPTVTSHWGSSIQIAHFPAAAF